MCWSTFERVNEFWLVHLSRLACLILLWPKAGRTENRISDRDVTDQGQSQGPAQKCVVDVVDVSSANYWGGVVVPRMLQRTPVIGSSGGIKRMKPADER